MVDTDVRASVAQYYDLNPEFPHDVPFYRALIPSATASILELGCGTGRVLLPLAEHCRFIHGVDRSEAMVALCRDKLAAANIAPSKATATVADITAFDLGRTFDLIIAPYRVMQNLASDAEVEGLFAGIRQHLAPGGSCVLNVFKPKLTPAEFGERWTKREETFCWEVPVPGGRVTCTDRRPRVDAEPLVLYPELSWRRYEGEALVDEATLRIAMRCYYPEQFTTLIEAHGFRIVKSWGGYAGETYGEGLELVVQFQ